MRTLMLIVGALTVCAGTALASGDDAGPWLRSLYKAKRVTNGDVYLAATLISDDKAWRQDVTWARKACDRRDYLRDNPKGGTDAHAFRGFAASVFARLLEIEGGLWSRIFDQPARYAYRDLVLLGIIAPGGADVPLSGDELAGLLIAAERYRKVGAERLPQRGVVP